MSPSITHGTRLPVDFERRLLKAWLAPLGAGLPDTRTYHDLALEFNVAYTTVARYLRPHVKRANVLYYRHLRDEGLI